MKLSSSIIGALTALSSAVNAAPSSNHRHILKARHDNLPQLTPAHHLEAGLLQGFEKRAKCAVRAPRSTAAPPSNVQAVANNPPVDSKSKKGICVNNPDWVNYSELKGKVGGVYNWSPWVDTKLWDFGMEPMPMLWGHKQEAEFMQKLSGYKSQGVQHLLAFNEPDQQGQSNMSPADAADLWWRTLATVGNQFNVIGPALTNSPGCIDWQRDFMGRLGDAGPKIMALHFYGTESGDFINYLNQFHSAFPNKEIWITEYACHSFGPGKCKNVWDFYGTMLEFFKNTPWIGMAFPFGLQTDLVGVDPQNALLKPDGSGLTDLGRFWANY